jgi:hypothetical protein
MPAPPPFSRAAPPRPRFDRAAAVRRLARDIRIGVRIVELRQLAQRTAAGELPAPPDALPEEDARR